MNEDKVAVNDITRIEDGLQNITDCFRCCFYCRTRR
jgi:hypothetical protein